MLFVWEGVIKPGAEMIPQDVNAASNDFLQQPFLKIHSAGPLCDENGQRTGMLMIFEADSREVAQALVENSPYLQAGIYGQHHLYEYRNEAG